MTQHEAFAGRDKLRHAAFTGRRFFIQFVDRRECGVRGVVAAMETVAWSSGCR